MILPADQPASPAWGEVPNAAAASPVDQRHRGRVRRK